MTSTPVAEGDVRGRTRDARPRAMVIGSGFGGLAAAVRLGARGYRVTVLEKLDRPGGRAEVFERDGFTFDAGPTIITAPFLFEELWQLCGRSMADDVELRPLDPFYRIRFHDGECFDYNGDQRAMEAQIARFDPADVAGYRRFIEVSERVYRIGFIDLLHVPFHAFSTMARTLPDLVRSRFYRSVHWLVARHIRDPRLRRVFSFHPLLVGGNPFTATAIYALVGHLERAHGVHFSMGGTGRLVDGLVRLVESQGGVVRFDAPVDEILIEGGRAAGVRLASGEVMRADVVVSNADSATTYRHLVPASHRRRWTDRRIERARYSMGLFVWYFGTRRRYPQVPHHLIMLGETYRELLDDIFRRKVLSDDFSLYLHRPTATDPSLAPPGCDTFYVLSPVPNTESGIDWSTMAERYRAAIAQRLEQTVLPGLTSHLATSCVRTPADFEDRFSAFRGAGFGFEPVLTQTGWFRPHNLSEEVPGLYLVGAGTHPGAGIPGVLSSAKVLEAVLPRPA